MTAVGTKGTPPGVKSAASQASPWGRFRLTDRFRIRYGRANPGGVGDVPVIGSSGVFAWTNEPLLTHPTIVIGRKGSVGKPWLIKGPCHPSDTTFYLEPRSGSDIDLEFLYYALSSARPEASDDVIPSLQRHHLETLELPLPPVPEQRAIAAVLSKIQAAAETQGKMVGKLRELRAATMASIFHRGLRRERLRQTDIGKLPASWDLVALGEHCRLFAGGTPARDNPAFWNGRIPWVKTGEIDYLPITRTEECITEEGLRRSSAKLVAKGAVLMAMYGQGVTRGKVARLEIDAATNQACLAIIPDASLMPGFLYAYFAFAYERIRELGHGANQKNLSADILKNMLVPSPRDLTEQQDIVDIQEALDSSLSSAVLLQQSLEGLFVASLGQLMTGRIRPFPGASKDARKVHAP